jgi:hypothetical protein
MEVYISSFLDLILSTHNPYLHMFKNRDKLNQGNGQWSFINKQALQDWEQKQLQL